MGYLKFGISACLCAVFLQTLLLVPEGHAQGVHEDCPCWQRLAQLLRKDARTETEDKNREEALWMTDLMYNVLPLAPEERLPPADQQPVERQHRRQTPLRALLLRRPTRSRQFTEHPRLACAVCWAALQGLVSSPSKQPELLPSDAFDFDFGEISKKAMMNNGW